MIVRTLTLTLTLVVAAGIARAQQPSPQLAQTIASVAAQLAPGQRPITQIYSTFGAHRAPVSFVVPLSSGLCYSFVGAGGMGVGDVDMFLFDPSNHRVALDRRADAWMNIMYCAVYAGPYRVELKVKRGAGEVGFQVFQGPPTPSAAPPPIAAPPPPATGDLLGQQLTQLAASVAPGQRLVAAPLSGFVGGRPHDQFIQLDGGRCYTIVTVSAPTVRRMNTYLWGPNDRRLATDRSPTNTSRLAFCTTTPGQYHFQAKGDGGGGEFRSGIYSQ